MDTIKPLDVAISFANEDLGLAIEIRDRIGGTLDVFVYATKQDEVAGTDGMESFRGVFRSRARLVVILYREKWGTTRWTRIEEEAIKDRFLDEGPGFLFVVMLDNSPPPKWLPDRLIRFMLKDFGIEQAVGAIKARAIERGSVVQRPSVGYLAARAHEKTEFERARTQLMNSEQGVQQVYGQARVLMHTIRDCAEEARSAAPDFQFEFGAADDWFVIRTRGVAVHVGYRNPVVNVLSKAKLVLRDLRGAVIMPGENLRYLIQPRELAEVVFTPELTVANGWCWKTQESEPLSNERFAELTLKRFFALVEADAAGELPSL
ncbi:MAG TPA: hypothetical protein VGW77_22035 [Candidatus Binatia bacterium]|jgi:hypothetical protein|nr:hypothetical protein [Candidatus Binatia bacterium]